MSDMLPAAVVAGCFELDKLVEPHLGSRERAQAVVLEFGQNSFGCLRRQAQAGCHRSR